MSHLTSLCDSGLQNLSTDLSLCLCYITYVASTAQSSVQILDFCCCAAMDGLRGREHDERHICCWIRTFSCLCVMWLMKRKIWNKYTMQLCRNPIQIMIKRESILIHASSHTSIWLDQAISQEYAGLCFNAHCPATETWWFGKLVDTFSACLMKSKI